MLDGLLSKEECARCRQCCSFERYDLWETPLITPKLRERIKELKPELEFISRENCYIMKMQQESGSDVFYCPLLDHSSGCILGDEKPFDCALWPFRLMSFEGKIVIAVSPLCPVTAERTLREISEKCRELCDYMFSQADEFPELVKPYIPGWPIIAAKP